MAITEFAFPGPNQMEALHYNVFPESLENDDLVLFHGTNAADWPSIQENGFQSSFQLKSEGLTSVSYAYKSSAALSHIRGRHKSVEVVIVAVKFDAVADRPGLVVNVSDIYVRDGTQPEILGFCKIPASYDFV